MTPKQQRFVEEYLVDLNAAAAARRAGYSVRTADAIGRENLGKPTVAAAIAAAQQNRSERTQVDSDWVLKRLHRDATADIADLFDEMGKMKPADQWPDAWRQGLVVGVESFEEYAFDDGVKRPTGMVRKLKLSERSKYVEMIGRHVDVAAFRDRVEHTGKGGGPIPVSVDLSGATVEQLRAIASLKLPDAAG